MELVGIGGGWSKTGNPKIENNFRLSLVSGTPVTTADATYSKAQSIYAVPYAANEISQVQSEYKELQNRFFVFGEDGEILIKDFGDGMFSADYRRNGIKE